jgi:predicted RNA-binding Zn-ribbon protein involved in translation (DUF1610 family)
MDNFYTRLCKNCGAALVFDPQKQKLVCPACGTEYDADELKGENVVELDLMDTLKAIEQYNEDDDKIVVHCPNCGANSEFPANVVATRCQYCNTPLTGSTLSQRTLRPQGIVPFAISHDAAVMAFRKWLQSLWFLPNKAKKLKLEETMQGVYRPLWTFDFKTTTRYTGERGEHYYVTKTRRVNGKTETYQERKTRWYPAAGTVHVAFDDILVPASNRMSKALQEECRWNLENAVDYSEDMIRGFDEESYDVRLRPAFEESKEKAKPGIQSAVRRDIGGDEQRITSMDTSYADLSYKLLLVPFWSATYRFKGKAYTYLVNGQTGMAHGERPWSVVKITFLILAILAIVIGLYIMFNQ